MYNIRWIKNKYLICRFGYIAWLGYLVIKESQLFVQELSDVPRYAVLIVAAEQEQFRQRQHLLFPFNITTKGAPSGTGREDT